MGVSLSPRYSGDSWTEGLGRGFSRTIGVENLSPSVRLRSPRRSAARASAIAAMMWGCMASSQVGIWTSQLCIAAGQRSGNGTEGLDKASVRIVCAAVIPRCSVSEHPVSKALRAQSPDLLRQLLFADLRDAEQEWSNDHRDLMVELAPYHDCAQRLGLDAAKEFRAAAADGPPRLREVVRTFGERHDVTLASFDYSLAQGPEGLSYRRSTSMSAADLRELREWLGDD